MPLPPPPPQTEHSRSVFRNNLGGETAYQRHQRLARAAQQYYGETFASGSKEKGKTDYDLLKERHRFLREDEDKDEASVSYEDAIAIKYYRNLFKEYAVCDLKHYKSGNISLRWRTEDEVVSGTGQFSCGNTRCAYHTADALASRANSPATPPLITLELPFGYTEDGKAKSALVKVVLCARCKKKLTWKRDKEKAPAQAAEGDQVSENHDDDWRTHTGGSRRRDRSRDEGRREKKRAKVLESEDEDDATRDRNQ